MKRLLIFAILLSIGSSTFAQDPDPNLLRTWYLHDLVLSGESNVPDNLGVDVTTQFWVDLVFQGYGIYVPLSDQTDIYSLEYEVGTSNFTTTFQFSIVDTELCFSNACLLFFQLFSNFYWLSKGIPMDYEINDVGGGDLQLIITDSIGDQAIYYSYELLGVDEFDSSSLTLFPNPVSDRLTISVEGIQVASITIFTMYGQGIMQPDNTSNVIDVSMLPSGIYFVVITSEEGKAIQRFIKK
jgi:hypothetical protein